MIMFDKNMDEIFVASILEAFLFQNVKLSSVCLSFSGWNGLSSKRIYIYFQSEYTRSINERKENGAFSSCRSKSSENVFLCRVKILRKCLCCNLIYVEAFAQIRPRTSVWNLIQIGNYVKATRRNVNL